MDCIVHGVTESGKRLTFTFTFTSVYPSTHLPTNPFLCPPSRFSVPSSIHLSIQPFPHPSGHLSIYPLLPIILSIMYLIILKVLVFYYLCLRFPGGSNSAVCCIWLFSWWMISLCFVFVDGDLFSECMDWDGLVRNVLRTCLYSGSPGQYWFKSIFDVYFSAWGFLGHMDSIKTCSWPMLQICSRECGQGLTLHIPKKSLALSQPLGGHLHDPGMSFLIRVSLFVWDLGSCWIVYADSVT